MKAEVTGGFWARRMAANQNAIAHGGQRLEEVGAIANLRIAAGEQTGVPTGQTFWDSDVYKRLEAVAWDGPGYARLRKVFRTGDQVVLELPMWPRVLMPDERVDASRGCVAVARGPLVYALEQPDQTPNMMLEDLRIDPTAEIQVEQRSDLLDGVTVLDTGGLTLIPYYAWANRGQHAMRVWIPS